MRPLTWSNVNLRWLKQAGLEGPELGHLKRIRKQTDLTSLLLSTAIDPPDLPADLNLPAPYLLPVPSSSALTLPSLNLKSALWPTMYTPRRKDEPEPWTRGKLKWAWDAMKKTTEAALKAQAENDEVCSTFYFRCVSDSPTQIPIAAHIPVPFSQRQSDGSSSGLTFTASDTRNSTRHPLRHATINVTRKLADYRASQSSNPVPLREDVDEVRNGSNYLLTDQTFFVTHEPCIMCSMALLHSRVKEVVYLYPMAQTGGCGGCACLPTLKGVNHRFGILHWKLGRRFGQFSKENIQVETTIDA